jgi:hypothetical protein
VQSGGHHGVVVCATEAVVITVASVNNPINMSFFIVFSLVRVYRT